jgi:hypothetical protein
VPEEPVRLLASITLLDFRKLPQADEFFDRSSSTGAGNRDRREDLHLTAALPPQADTVGGRSAAAD